MPTAPPNHAPRRPPRHASLGVALILVTTAAFALPLVAMLAASAFSQAQADRPFSIAPLLTDPAGAAAQASRNYRDVWTSDTADFPLYLKNSLLVTSLSVVGMVLSSAAVAFGLTRVRWRGARVVFALVLASLMIPFTVLMAPLYLVYRELGWIGTFLPLWAPAWLGGAFSIFLLRQFFLTIPREIDEAARLDGCSEPALFLRVILPAAAPALALVAILQFVASWNDFLQPLLVLNHPEQYTVALGLQMYQSQHGGTPWNLVMAATTLAVLPVLAVYFIASRRITDAAAASGITE
ncbi:MAG: carbohydrate ABC transporter permease [Phycisphaeraceae bacterium]|nr:MAG: carbohydrate ABC transporter permease [Phycisphaeraceae bacterium]